MASGGRGVGFGGLVCDLDGAATHPFERSTDRTGDAPGGQAITVEQGSINIRNIRLNRCIAWAYSISEIQISGPGWLDDTTVQIAAKAGTAAKQNELRLMMQS